MSAMPPANPMDQLRDIHLPDPVSIWPLAPGWWVLAAVLLIAGFTAACLLYRRYQRNAYRRAAASKLDQLASLKNTHSHGEYLQALNRLLKQTALSMDQPEDVSGLAGTPWLEFLDRCSNSKEFTEGSGRILEDGPYRDKLEAVELESLHHLASRWIREHKPPC